MHPVISTVSQARDIASVVKINTLFNYFKLKDGLPSPRGPLSAPMPFHQPIGTKKLRWQDRSAKQPEKHVPLSHSAIFISFRISLLDVHRAVAVYVKVGLSVINL